MYIMPWIVCREFARNVKTSSADPLPHLLDGYEQRRVMKSAIMNVQSSQETLIMRSRFHEPKHTLNNTRSEEI